jgi:hypothetical protein
MFKVVGTLIFLFVFSQQQVFAYKNVPVLVNVNADAQHDTIGFNLCRDLAVFLYPLILDGKIRLYSGFNKEFVIDGASLQDLERQHEVSFEKALDLFINELWSNKRNKTSFHVFGLSFVTKTDAGERIFFGYLDYTEIQSFLENAYIPVNMNGFCQTSYHQAIYSKIYSFQLVQFGNESFQRNPSLSFQIQQKAFGKTAHLKNKSILQPCKEIVYSVKAKTFASDMDRSNILLQSIEKLFYSNPELYYNLSPDSIYGNFMNYPPLHVSQIDIIEKRFLNENLQSRADFRLRFTINGIVFEPIKLTELITYLPFSGLVSLEDEIKLGRFDSQLISINQSGFGESCLSYSSLEALYVLPWHRLSDYFY